MKIRFKKLYSHALVDELRDILTHYFCRHADEDQSLVKDAKDVLKEIDKLLDLGYENEMQ